MGSQDEFQSSTHSVAGRATTGPREQASLVDAFHGPVVCILDTHSLNITTRARCWLRVFGTTDASLLLVGALVGGL